MAANLNTWTSVTYKAIDSSKTNSFARPRQKTWGVFIRSTGQQSQSEWTLVEITHDFKYGKLRAQAYIKNPPAGYSGYQTGINSVILCEIAPADVFVSV